MDDYIIALFPIRSFHEATLLPALSSASRFHRAHVPSLHNTILASSSEYMR
jgi:hypothetical protein